MGRIAQTFQNRKEGEKIMSLFITAGYPEIDSSAEIILGLEKNGADMIELGIPFSDPLADGPTIQYSSDLAIKNGVSISKIFETVKEVRKSSEIPIILMGYMNPVLRYGVEKFCVEAKNAGVDGLILPDIPINEGGIIEKFAEKNDLPIIYLVAPNTSDDRLKLTNQKSKGFVYCVSVTGVTGARQGDEVSNSVDTFISRVKTHITDLPVMVGFGIKSYEDAMCITSIADGFIVGSALIDVVRKNYPDSDWKSELYKFVHSLKFGS